MLYLHYFVLIIAISILVTFCVVMPKLTKESISSLKSLEEFSAKIQRVEREIYEEEQKEKLRDEREIYEHEKKKQNLKNLSISPLIPKE